MENTKTAGMVLYFYHAADMNYHTIAPPADLAPYVRFFWILETSLLPHAPYVYRSMADGSAEMIFHYKGTFEELTDEGNIAQAYAMIHAQTQHYRRFVTTESFGIFGVYLYPFTIPQLCRISAAEAADHTPDLHTLFGAEGRQLEEQVLTAPGNTERIHILSAFLRKRLLSGISKETTIHTAIRTLIHNGAHMSVQEMSAMYHLSPRQLERQFKEQAGFSPKLFSRIIRFHSAMAQYKNTGTKSLTEIGYECGYYDQSHFIRDFKTFSGYHPGHFFAGNAEGNEYRDV
jgi:AraC-like DNA-binding protein